MAGNKNSELEQKKEENESLVAAISNMSYSEYSRLTDFITLSQDLKAKQEALDIMAADTTPSAIGASYVADTLEPNSQGDLVTLVAKTSGEQVIIDNIYRRLNIPLDKVVYSLFKNAMVIAEFAHESDVRPIEKGFGKMISAVEGTGEKSSTEDVMVKINKSRVVPKIRIISDTTRVFPILQYENVVGYIEITTDILNEFDFTSDYVSYKDVVIHPASDYTYVKFGFRTESNPLRLKVKQEDGTIMEYDIDQGRSLLESAYPAWQTLSIMRDAINLARLAYSASSVVVQTEVGNMTEAQIELARNKLKDLFENRLAYGKNGAKSYLQPQIKPNYIYAFTSNGVGAITTSTIGGDYNPGVLTDLQYFEDEFFGGMGAVKQHYARTSDSAGLDGGGAVEQYEKRYKSYVSQFKRLTAQFIKNCINNILLSRNLFGTYDNFEVKLNKAYQEDDYQEINLQQTKLGFLQSAIDFLGVEDPKKLTDLKLQALKTVITDKNFLEALSQAVLENPTPGSGVGDNGGELDEIEDLGGTGGGGNGLMDQISTIGTPDEDLSPPTETPEGVDETGGEEIGGGEPADELPPVSDVVPESQIDEGE